MINETLLYGELCTQPLNQTYRSPVTATARHPKKASNNVLKATTYYVLLNFLNIPLTELYYTVNFEFDPRITATTDQSQPPLATLKRPVNMILTLPSRYFSMPELFD